MSKTKKEREGGKLRARVIVSKREKERMGKMLRKGVVRQVKEVRTRPGVALYADDGV